MRPVLAFAAVFALSACASVGPTPPPAAPDFSEITPMAAPARTVLYTDCLAQAIERPAVARLSRGEAELLRFTCTGAPAHRFYEAVAVLVDHYVSVLTDGQPHLRATAVVQATHIGLYFVAPIPLNYHDTASVC